MIRDLRTRDLRFTADEMASISAGPRRAADQEDLRCRRAF